MALGHRLLGWDPLDEGLHRQLMQLWALAGQMPQALARWRRSRR